MSALFFYLLFLVLTADGLMVFLTPVVVYMLTGSIAYSGLSYAIWWLPRLILIPLIGRCIDSLGIKPLSILSDCIKTVGCLLLIFHTSTDPFIISISFGLVGSLISIGNSQTLIAYEKIIAILSSTKEHHVNIMSRIDFLGMIIGSLIGMLFIDIGYQYLLMIPCLFYLANASYFACTRLHDAPKPTNKGSTTLSISNLHNTHSLKFIVFTPIILGIIILAIGNNMFDGIVESSGTALIDQNMKLPVKYFGLIDIAAGICGVIGTYIYSHATNYLKQTQLLSVGLFIIILPSLILILFPESLFIFIACYAISIIGKVITGNISRLIRIEVIPTPILASTSSLIVFFNQSILPIVGISLFFLDGKNNIITLLMIFSILLTFIAGSFVIKNLVIIKR